MKCVICKEVEIGEPKYCCSGWMCGCMGMPIDPPWCYECHVKIDSKELPSERTNNQGSMDNQNTKR